MSKSVDADLEKRCKAPESRYMYDSNVSEKSQASNQAMLDQLVDSDAPQCVWDWQDGEEHVLGYLMHEIDGVREFSDLVSPTFFHLDADVDICRQIFDYFKLYAQLPQKNILKDLISRKFTPAPPAIISEKDLIKKADWLFRIEAISSGFVPNLTSRQFLHDYILEYCRKSETKKLIKKMSGILKDNKLGDEDMKEFAGKLSVIQMMGNKTKNKQLAYSIEELMNLPPISFDIDKHFPMNSNVVLYGPWGSGKSFIALEMALCKATGLPLFNQYPVKQGPVAYIAAEGKNGIAGRIRGWLDDHGIKEYPKNFVLLPQAFDLQGDPSSPVEIARIARDKLGVDPSMIFIDTLARNFGGGDENSAKDMNKYIANCDQLSQICNATVMSIHHTGKDFEKGCRGSVALGAAADAMISTRGNPEDGIEVKNVKQKDAALFVPYILKQKLMPIPNDLNGTLVLKWDGFLKLEASADKKAIADQANQEEYQVMILCPELNADEVGVDNSMTNDKLMAKLGWEYLKVHRVTSRAVEHKKIQRKKLGKGNAQPYYYWREKVLSGCA